MIAQGALGAPADARIEVSVRTPWHMWPWIAQQERLEIMFHSIHYLDALRYLCGDPARVSSFHSRWPGQPEVGETRTLTVFEYADGLRRVTIDVNHHNWSDDAYARFRFLGTDGSSPARSASFMTTRTGRVDTLAYSPRREPLDVFRPTLNMVDPGRLRRSHGLAHGSDPERRRTDHLRSR